MNIRGKSFIFSAAGALILAAAFVSPTWGQNEGEVQNQNQVQNRIPNANQNAHPPQVGSVNFVEGQASIDGQPLTTNSVGSVNLEKGQTLTTQAGKVEVLLTPGVFLRVGDNSAVKMISPDLANTEAEVDKGEAMVEVTDISKNNRIRIDENGANAQLLKKGLYDFDVARNRIRVFSGKAEVYARNSSVGVGGDHQVNLDTGGKLKSQGFDSKQYADELYRWSGLRAGYLAEAGADQARLYVNGGPGWAGTGWYWDPWFGSYTFIPGDGIFYSPFGWGFYSPFAVWGSPYFYGGYYGGIYGRPHSFGEFHEPYGHGFEPQGGFHGGFGGGFHGGGGGFHGGGGGRR